MSYGAYSDGWVKLHLCFVVTLPSFRLGYSGQQYDQGGYLSGLEAGVSLHLFTGPARRRVAARRVDVAVAEDRLEATRLRYAGDLAALRAEITRAAGNAAFQREQLSGTLAEVLRVARLNYQAGSLGYLEVLDALRTLAAARQSLLDETLTHNLAVYRLQFLRNE